jgi:hypothetical protein
MLVRVRDFGAAHGGLFPQSTVAATSFAAVAAAVQQLSEHAIDKMATRRQGVATKRAARTALYHALAAVSRTARVIAKDDPDLRNKFRIPLVKSDQALLTTGRLFGRAAEPLSAQFVARGMPPAFIADLNALVTGFDAAIRKHYLGRNENTAARVRIEAALGAGLAAVRELDVVVANHLRNEPATLAAWERDRRVEHPKTGKAATASNEPHAAPVVTPPQGSASEPEKPAA